MTKFIEHEGDKNKLDNTSIKQLLIGRDMEIWK